MTELASEEESRPLVTGDEETANAATLQDTERLDDEDYPPAPRHPYLKCLALLEHVHVILAVTFLLFAVFVITNPRQATIYNLLLN